MTGERAERIEVGDGQLDGFLAVPDGAPGPGIPGS